MRLALTAFILSMLWTGVASAQPFAYITNEGSNSVSVIDTATNMEVKTILVGMEPTGVAVSPYGNFVYVTNSGSGSVSVIDTATNTEVLPRITVGTMPEGIAVM
jgi:YVTN family beta-propeller protein